MARIGKILRRVRTLLWTALTLLTVLAAVLVGVGKLLMPYSSHYQPQLEEWLSKTFNQPVRVESFNGEWKAFGPRISLQGVIFTPQGSDSEIAIQQAALDIKPLNALIPGRPLYSFRIIGADLALVRTEDGRYLLSGLGVNDRKTGEASGQGLANIGLNGEVRLEESSLSFDDQARRIHLLLTNVSGRLHLDNHRLGAEIQARVSDREKNRVLGDLNAVVQVRLDKEQHLASARWHVNTGELMLARLVRQLPQHPLLPVTGWLNAEIWGEWSTGSPQKMQGVVDLRDVSWSGASGPLSVAHLNSRFNWRYSQRRNWRIDLSDLLIEQKQGRWQSKRVSIARNLPGNLGLWVSSDFLKLDFPIRLTQRIMASYDTPWPATLPRRATGKVRNFDLLLDGTWRLEQASGVLENSDLSDWGRGPGISGLGATVNIRNRRGDVSFGGQAVTLNWPRVFRKPVTVGTRGCHGHVVLEARRQWRIDVDQCRIENRDLGVFGRVRLASGAGKPEVDINVVMDHGDISRFGDYWPHNILRKPTLQWLRTSLLAGRVEKARFSLFGDLDDFPFLDHSGHMQAIVKVVDADLSYAEGWPRARQIDAVAAFDDASMLVTGSIGDAGGAAIGRVSARIRDLRHPVLDVDYLTSADMSDVADFIKQTPLLDKVSLDPDQFQFSGPVEVEGHIHKRIKDAADPLTVAGTAELKGVHFSYNAGDVVLDGIKGTLAYSQDGLHGDAFNASYKDYPGVLDIGADWDAKEVFHAGLRSKMPVDKVIPEELLQSEPLFSRASGTSDWVIGLAVKSVAGQADRETWLDISSDLVGVAIGLPAPLKKDAADAWPLRVHYPVRTAARLLTADVPGHAQLKMELAQDDSRPLRAALQLNGTVSGLPAAGLFDVRGSAAKLDLDGWIDLTVSRLSRAGGGGGLAMRTADVQAGQVVIFNRLFDNVALTMDYEDDVITGTFDGENIDGKVRYYKNEQGSHSLTGEFERLVMPDPVGGGVTMESDPAEMPEVHFYSKEFSYLGLDLGETRIEGYPIQNGYHIASVEAQSPQLDFDATGDWLRDAGGVRSDFKINITSESLGALLDAMDISSVVQGGQTVIHFDAWWKGPPAAFALERLNGDMDLSVVQGNIVNAEPGAGRMLGLLSLSELPRRLSMDFRDVFGSGFSFDEAKGSMHFENGTSFADDLKLTSTTAEITITGSTDMVAKTFDYEFTVRPGVSKSFPMIGALAGGPVGAAAGLALQALLRDSLGDATEARYSIRGPWTAPIVTRLNVPADNGKNKADKNNGNKKNGHRSNGHKSTGEKHDGEKNAVKNDEKPAVAAPHPGLAQSTNEDGNDGRTDNR